MDIQRKVSFFPAQLDKTKRSRLISTLIRDELIEFEKKEFAVASTSHFVSVSKYLLLKI
jgi:hypothetical protein